MNEDQNEESLNRKNYCYRLRYPDGPDGNNGYTATGLTVTKFERDYQQALEYQFIKSYPISISSMPVSYDTSGLLKCTVSMTYLRYVVIQSNRKDPIQNLLDNTDSEGNYQSQVTDPTLKQIQKYTTDKNPYYSPPLTGANAERAKYM